MLLSNKECTWFKIIISENEISLLYYFNDKNTDLQKNFDLLNSLGDGYGLAQRSWKLPFKMRVSDSESWNRDCMTYCKTLF